MLFNYFFDDPFFGFFGPLSRRRGAELISNGKPLIDDGSLDDFNEIKFEKVENEDGVDSYTTKISIPKEVSSGDVHVTVTKCGLLKIEYSYKSECCGVSSENTCVKSVSIPSDADKESISANFDNEKHIVIVSFEIFELDEKLIELDIEDDKPKITPIKCDFE